jgi:hypothetical protein
MVPLDVKSGPANPDMTSAEANQSKNSGSNSGGNSGGSADIGAERHTVPVSTTMRRSKSVLGWALSNSFWFVNPQTTGAYPGYVAVEANEWRKYTSGLLRGQVSSTDHAANVSTTDSVSIAFLALRFPTTSPVLTANPIYTVRKHAILEGWNSPVLTNPPGRGNEV